MSAFDDDDYRGNFVNVNDFEEEDDDVMDNWEDVLDEEEEEERKKKEKEAEEERKRKEREEKLAKRAAEKARQEQIQALMNAKPLSKEEQERAQLKAAEAAANDLFGFDDDKTDAKVASLVTSTAGLSLNNPDSVDTYVPVDPEDFAELSRRIVKKLKNYQTDEGYISFIRDLIPELCSEMTSDDIKKVSNPLVNLTHEKSRQEKEAKKKAQQASSKKSSLNTQKKQTDNRSDFLLNEYKHMDNYDDYDDFDDFM